MKVHKTAKEDQVADVTILGVTITPEIAKAIRIIRAAMQAAAIMQVITAVVTIMNVVREEMKDRTIDSRRVDQARLSSMNQSLRSLKANVKNRAVLTRTKISVPRKPNANSIEIRKAFFAVGKFFFPYLFVKK